LIFLALTVGRPLIDILADRLRESGEASRRAAAAKRLAAEQQLEAAQRALKPSLSESLLDLPSAAQVALRRGEGLADDLRSRGSKFSQAVQERSSDFTRDLLEKSEAARKQSEQALKELTERSEKAARKLSKQGKQISQELTQGNRRKYLAALGFSIGLVTAGIIAFVLMRKRVQQQQEPEEDQHILLSLNGHQNQEPAIPATPEDARLLGVVSTKRYYPVETPLDQLPTPPTGAGEEPSDIIYFSSEEEARAQGFTAAE
jgi:hypothetical protein